jgi:hypothetical protein
MFAMGLFLRFYLSARTAIPVRHLIREHTIRLPMVTPEAGRDAETRLRTEKLHPWN